MRTASRPKRPRVVRATARTEWQSAASTSGRAGAGRGWAAARGRRIRPPRRLSPRGAGKARSGASLAFYRHLYRISVGRRDFRMPIRVVIADDDQVDGRDSCADVAPVELRTGCHKRRRQCMERPSERDDADAGHPRLDDAGARRTEMCRRVRQELPRANMYMILVTALESARRRHRRPRCWCGRLRHQAV